jgi:hypothetical protein
MPVVSQDEAVAYRLGAAQVLGIGRTSLYRYLKQDGYDEVVKVRSASRVAVRFDMNRFDSNQKL